MTNSSTSTFPSESRAYRASIPLCLIGNGLSMDIDFEPLGVQAMEGSPSSHLYSTALFLQCAITHPALRGLILLRAC